MSIGGVGRTNFQNGMRVAREHLDHLQEVVQRGAEAGRQSAGLGKVCFGLRVEATGPAEVSIAAGVAFDRAARVLTAEPKSIPLAWDASTQLHLVIEHVLRPGEDEFKGEPTLYYDDAKIEVRPVPPPYPDDAVVFARLDRVGEAVEVTQLGEWFLPSRDHTHSGAFVEQDGLWRYDGHPLGHPPARFDSGFVAVGRGDAVTLVHGLGEADLLVQLQARRTDGVVTSAGFGTGYWYELAKPGEIRLVCATDGLELRAMIWSLHPASGGPLLPLAHAGPDLIVEPGASFSLDASASRAFGGRQLAKYIWTEIT